MMDSLRDSQPRAVGFGIVLWIAVGLCIGCVSSAKEGSSSSEDTPVSPVQSHSKKGAEASSKGVPKVEDFTGYWMLEVRGTVVKVERKNIDKSGRNPKWMISFWMECDPPATAALPPGYTLTQEIRWKVKSTRLKEWEQSEPVVGDRLQLTARGYGLSPELFGVFSLRQF